MNIEDLRKELDKIDFELIRLFQERIEISKNIGYYKLKNNIEIFDEKREKFVIDRNIKNVPSSYQQYVIEFTKFLMTISKEVQKCLK